MKANATGISRGTYYNKTFGGTFDCVQIPFINFVLIVFPETLKKREVSNLVS